MPTPLFPPDSETITLNQGKTGDCYLLAALDCIVNVGTAGRAQFKSMFRKTDDGVYVSIKRTPLSDNLKPKMLEGKYVYKHHRGSKVDEFFISNERLELIDAADSIGVKSNSLAIKILEHISSYYFLRTWDHREAHGSIRAHSAPNGVERHSVYETAFVGQLVGVESDRVNRIEDVIKLKKHRPDFPVYVAINWGGVIHGTTHPRHALRVQSILPKGGSTTDYEFVLVNPWDNTKTETYTLQQIKDRDPAFSMFAPTKPEIDSANLLINLSEDDGAYLQSKPQLGLLIQKVKKNELMFNLQDAQRLIKLYRSMPSIAAIYDSLTNKQERDHFYTCVYRGKAEKDAFINLMIDKFDRIEIIREVIRAGLPEESRGKILDLCVQTKDAELFATLSPQNVFSHLLHTDLDRDTFLKNLIDLESAATLPNAKRLKEIDDYIKAHNIAHPKAQLKATVKESLIEAAVLSKDEASVAQARINVLLTMDAIKAFSFDFTTAHTTKDVEALRLKFVAQINAKGDDLTSALALLNPRDANKIRQVIKEKLGNVQIAADRETRYIKHLESTIEKYVKAIDFPVSFGNDFDARSVQLHAEVYSRRLEEIAANEELLITQASLSVRVHPAIAEAIKNKKAQIETVAKNRIVTLEHAEVMLQRGIQEIAGFSASFSTLYSVRDINAEITKQMKSLRALLETPALQEAQRQLGITSVFDSDLKAAYDNKQRTLVADANNRLALIGNVENTVQSYKNAVKSISINYTSATNESTVRSISASLMAKLIKLTEEVENNKDLEHIPTAKTEILNAIKIHESVIVEEAIISHNRLIYAQLENALTKSGFKDALNRVVVRSEAAQIAAGMDASRFGKSAGKSAKLCEALKTAQVELMEMPTDGKLSSVKVQQKLEAFQKKAINAIATAFPDLKSNTTWRDQLNALEKSTSLLSQCFTTPAPSNITSGHGLFASTSSTKLRTGVDKVTAQRTAINTVSPVAA